MPLPETLLQEAIARYCSYHQDQIVRGELSEELLQENILTGIQSIFGQGSGLRQAVGGAVDKVKDAYHTGKEAVQQGVQRIQNDYTAGAVSGALQQLAQQREDAEEDFTYKMDQFKQNVAQIQQQRYALRKEHRAIMRSFHQKAHQHYVRAGQALNIPFVKGDAFYDAVDQALEARNLVPKVLMETWDLTEELDSSQDPVEETSTVPTF